ncbi:12030_t:CDS:2, partial [Gigaspora margarita]
MFNTYELNDLELCFASNNDDGSNLFTEILDNNGQLITEEEDNSLTYSDNEVDDILNAEKDLYLLTKGKCFSDWNEVESWLNKHGCERGFAFSLVKSERDKTNGHHYEVQKKAHTLEKWNKTYEILDVIFMSIFKDYYFKARFLILAMLKLQCYQIDQ